MVIFIFIFRHYVIVRIILPVDNRRPKTQECKKLNSDNTEPANTTL